ncbi:hypothetical protein RclHR1_02150028 [Rhizophagus clarus]|uniref:F-box domain-containing protein n=1 Tax=Rhizophagus clarus TaxID=94130 RepID=A0A2Z6R8N4_9GLOM|nr:hypothetical protein RclHR1_02150028 [Rhizophagus clarus]GET03422.1 hypothetical protein GLOIN_2v1661053 [Rhizophagus clarus]
MPELNNKLLSLILEELQNDGKSLYSCLLVNKTWCEIFVPILWKIPGRFKPTSSNAIIILFNTIISHLPKESKNTLKENGINFIEQKYDRPLFNYIGYCENLNLYHLESMISIKNIEKSKRTIVRKEILKLFINKDTRFSNLYISKRYNHQIHLFPGVEHCFSGLEHLCCNVNVDKKLLEGLAKTSNSIKKLELRFNIMKTNNYEIIKLIEAQQNLNFVCLSKWPPNVIDHSYCKTLEESLIKNANSIKCLSMNWKPVTNILSRLVNLISLDINSPSYADWNYLENVCLPNLKILKTQNISSKNLENLIQNTKGSLVEISISHEGNDNKNLIKVIYQNCPSLKYLKISFNSNDIRGLENLLIECKYLSGLVINILDNKDPDWDNLFEILIRTSPMGLFRFKIFYYYKIFKFKSLKSFLDNWNGHPILLHLFADFKRHQQHKQQINDLINKYITKGSIKAYDLGDNFEDFEWFQNKPLAYF